MDTVELGTRIARARELLAVSQDSLASALGVNRSAISRIESGDRKVGVMDLLAIAEHLKRPLSFFVAPAVPAVISRRRDGEHAHATSTGLDEEIRALASDVEDLLDLGVLTGVDRDSVSFPLPQDHWHAEQAARRVRSVADETHAGPINDLGGFAERLGLVTFAAALTLQGPDGGCVEVGKPGVQLGVAVINGDAPSGRRRMTLAHELGHWLTGDAYDHEASAEAESMLNSFAIHLLAPRAGVMGVWNEHPTWTDRNRAISVAAIFRISWSAALAQLRNLDLISNLVHGRLLASTPASGDFALLGFSVRAEPNAPYLSPRFTSQVLEAFTTEDLTSERTVELLRGVVESEGLPPLEDAGIDSLQGAFTGHSS